MGISGKGMHPFVEQAISLLMGIKIKMDPGKISSKNLYIVNRIPI